MRKSAFDYTGLFAAGVLLTVYLIAKSKSKKKTSSISGIGGDDEKTRKRFSKFLNRIFEDKSYKDDFFVSLSEKRIKEIEKLIGIEVKSLRIESDYIRHAHNSHKDLTIDDFLLILEVVKNGLVQPEISTDKLNDLGVKFTLRIIGFTETAVFVRFGYFNDGLKLQTFYKDKV